MNLLHHSQCHTQVIIPETELGLGHDGVLGCGHCPGAMMRTEVLASDWLGLSMTLQ